MLIIRLTRHGAKRTPFYHVTVADRAAKRDGKFVERVGFYNPVSRGNAESLRLNLERIDHWLAVGAQPSETVARLVSKARKAAAAEVPAAAAAESA